MPDVFAGRRRVPRPENDPNLSYAPGTAARAELKARLKTMAAETVDIPIIIGGKEVRTGKTEKVVMPHKHGHVLGKFHKATPEHVRLPRVELAHAVLARAQPNLDRHPRFARQGSYQLDIEARRLAVFIEIFVGRKLRVAAVDERTRLSRLRPRHGGERKQTHGGQEDDPAAHGRIVTVLWTSLTRRSGNSPARRSVSRRRRKKCEVK